MQGEGGDLRGRIGLAVGLDPGVAVRGLGDLVGDELLVLFHHRVVVAPADQALGRLADEPLALFGERHNRGRRAHTLSILDDFWSGAFHHGNAGIGCAEIDADDLAHRLYILPRYGGSAGP